MGIAARCWVSQHPEAAWRVAIRVVERCPGEHLERRLAHEQFGARAPEGGVALDTLRVGELVAEFAAAPPVEPHPHRAPEVDDLVDRLMGDDEGRKDRVIVHDERLPGSTDNL